MVKKPEIVQQNQERGSIPDEGSSDNYSDQDHHQLQQNQHYFAAAEEEKYIIFFDF